MEADEFLSFSGRVVSYGKAGARSAISRAYYSVFHLAHETLEVLGSAPPRSGSSHNLIPFFLRCSSHPNAVAAASLIADLHNDRIKADYRLRDDKVETQAYAMIAVETADRVRLFRSACAAESVRRELVEGINELKRRLGLP
jgi:hypothetical protein